MTELNDFLLFINAIACGAISLRLGTYQRKGARYRLLASFVAWILIVSSGAVCILIVTGNYSVMNPAETAINISLCMATYAAKGNVMRLFYPNGSRSAVD